MNNHDLHLKFKQFIKHRIIGTQYEWESHIENIFHIFERNLTTYIPNNILDVGCGNGDRTVRIANHFNVDSNNVFGLDYNDDSITTCKKMFNATKLDLESEGIPYAENTFDFVICNQVLEHLKNYKNVIVDLIRVTRKSGYIAIGIPNLAHLINRIYLLFGIQPMCISMDSSHVRGFTHNSFVKMLTSFHNIELIDYKGAIMYPLPHFIARYTTNYFTGLSGYICYLLRKSV
jgi:ubiquinone/menaquinone biosynthesis C-methylase UbiE